MKKVIKKRKWWKWCLAILLTPFVLFFIIAILVYIPPVQQFVVDQVAEKLSEESGVEVSVGKVRLAFPLDLAVHGVLAKDQLDTLAEVRVMRLKVRMFPLVRGIVDVDGLEVYDAQVNTGRWIPDLYLRGHIKKFSAASHGVNLQDEVANIDYATLDGANLFIALGDSTISEPSAPTLWNLLVDEVKLSDTKLQLSFPGDSMRVAFHAGKALLENGQFDLGASAYHVDALKLQAGALTYAVLSSPDSLMLEEESGVDTLSLDSCCCSVDLPVVTKDIAFSQSDSLLWEEFEPDSIGIDPNYIVLQKLDFELNHLHFLNQGQMGLEVRRFFLRERSGIQVDQLAGNMVLSKGKLCLSDFSLRTPTSQLSAQSEVWLDSILEGKNDYGRLVVSGEISPADVALMGQGWVDPSILDRWPNSPLKVSLDVTGTSQSVQLDTFRLDWPRIARLKLTGQVLQPFSDDRIGELDFNLRTADLSFVHSLMKTEGITELTFPKNFSLYGKANVRGADYALNGKILGGEGQVSLEGKLNLDSWKYQAKLLAEHFPLSSFLPGFGPLSASVSVEGKGTDFFDPKALLQTQIHVDTLKYDQWQLGQLKLSLNLAEQKGVAHLVSENDVLEGEATLDLSLGEMIELSLKSELYNLYLSQLMDLKAPLSFGSTLSMELYTDRKMQTYGLGGDLTNIRFITEEKGIQARDLYFSFDSSVDTTLLTVSSGDMDMNLAASGNVEKISKDLGNFFTVFEQQLLTKKLDQAALKQVAPTLDFRLNTGGVNPVVNLFKEMGYNYQFLAMDLSMSPEQGALGNLRLSGFAMGEMLLDTIQVGLRQDTTGLVADAWVKNFKKRNKTKFEATLKSYLLNSGAGAELMIKNQDGVKGMDFGIIAGIQEQGVKVHLYPEHPVIAFRDFTVNKDNFVFLGNDSTILADVRLQANDGTGLRVYSQPADSVNDLTISLNHLDLSALSGVFPYVPSIAGIFNGDLHIVDNHQDFSAMAALTVDDFVLEGAPFGNVGAEIIYLPQDSTQHHASMFISANDEEVLSLNGLYQIQDGQESFEGNAELLSFPLELMNGFLVGTDLAMSGKANGVLNVTGDMSKPDLNGSLSFHEAHLYSEAYGFDFRMDEQPVKMEDNQMVVKDYALSSRQSKNPLLLNGKLDMRNLSKVELDLSMAARNFELINAKKQVKSLVYGKVYADFEGTMKGALEDLTIRGKLSILDRTDMTYILKDSPLTVDDRLHDLVQFVDFEEPEIEEEAPVEPSAAFDMTLGISINNAALFHCNLSEDGANYVDLEGGGDLTLRLTHQGDMRLTGRFTANSGEMKYSLPVIPLKTFKLVRGSYVDFTGDPFNPTLSIVAKERMKAMVTENEQPRSVAFDVGVSITQPLDRMGLEFIIDAPEDLSVQNQLAAMTKAERGKAAVGMLATGMYLTDESLTSSTSGFKASNALTSFLQSEIQNIAGSALKTIDLTIGMENNTTATGATTTDYSFQFAKRFWGNRISVIVGGKVSTGSEAENSAESFIDNVAIEYRLDKTASRYVRVFYERSFQDPLEGQLTKTGAGLMLRRKSDRLGDLFIFRNRDSKKKNDKSSKAKH